MSQSQIALTMLLKPLGFLLLLGIAYPFRIWTQRFLPEGRIKRLLLRRINNGW